MRRSEERFRRALENIPDVVVIYDTDLRIRYINEATWQLTGRPTSDYIGKREEEVWPPEVYQTYLPILKESAKTLQVRSLETELRLPGNQIRHLKITCIPLTNKAGKLIEVVGITHDFTESKQAELALKKSEARVRAKLDAILLPEGDLGILDMSDIIDVEPIQKIDGRFLQPYWCTCCHIGYAG